MVYVKFFLTLLAVGLLSCSTDCSLSYTRKMAVMHEMCTNWNITDKEIEGLEGCQSSYRMEVIIKYDEDCQIEINLPITISV